MKKGKVVLVVSLALVVVLLAGLAGACARPVPSPTQPTAATKPSPPPTASPKPASSPAPVAKQPPKPAQTGPLAQIVEGAQKEGTVSITLLSSYMTPQTKQRIEKDIKDKFGVSLDVKIISVSSKGKMMADALLEYKTGAVPTYDLMTFDSDYTAEGMAAGVFAEIDWKPLLLPGTNPEVVSGIPSLRSSIAYQTGLNGLEYNPTKVSANEVPKTISDLANPKWKGKLGIWNYPVHWARWAFILGKDKTIATLKEIMKNKPALGTYADLSKRYLLGEISVVFTVDSYLLQDRDKGMPTEWRSLEFVDSRDNTLVLLKKAKHPNAAKLLAVYLASPEGAKVTATVFQGTRFYPGNHVGDIVAQAQKLGIPVHPRESYPGYLEFSLSKEHQAWQKEIELILKGA